jgi:hypothetical protein
MANPALGVLDNLPGRALVPAPIEMFGRQAERWTIRLPE